MSKPDAASPDARNERTVRAYESYAPLYAEATVVDPSRPLSVHLSKLVDAVPAAATILEIGSGPGWEADLLEARGLRLRRTDVTARFLDLQRRRGKAVEKLDVLTDELGGPHDAVMAMCVLQHIERSLIPSVLRRIFAALRPGGVLLVSVRDGRGDLWEGDYYTVRWDRASFESALSAAGMTTEWAETTREPEGVWLTFLARRAA